MVSKQTKLKFLDLELVFALCK